jgi:hypothetical protein
MRFRWIDRLLSLEERRAARANRCVSFEEAMMLRAGSARGVPPTLCVDWLSHLAVFLVAESTSFRSVAVLDEIERFACHGYFLAGDIAEMSIQIREWREDGMSLIGTIHHKEKIMIEVSASLRFLSLARCYDEAELRAMLRAARGEFPRPVGLR